MKMLSAVALLLLMTLALSKEGKATTCYRCLNLMFGEDLLHQDRANCTDDLFGEQVECEMIQIPGFEHLRLGCTITYQSYRYSLFGEEKNTTYMARDCGFSPSEDGCYRSEPSSDDADGLEEFNFTISEIRTDICFCNQDLCNGDFDIANAPNLDSTGPPRPKGYAVVATTSCIGVLLLTLFTFILL